MREDALRHGNPLGRDTSALDGQRTQQSGTSGQGLYRRPPDESDVHKFRQALERAEPQGDSAGAGMPAGPFDLLARRSSPFEPALEGLKNQLRDMVSRLLVSDGQQSARSVRMALDHEALPGVELSVFEEEGAWVAHFDCTTQSAFLDLVQVAQDMASRMATALHRECVWRVRACDLPPGEPWCRVENLLPDGVTVQARAHGRN